MFGLMNNIINSFKCLIGLHDWKQLKCKTHSKIEIEAIKELLGISIHYRRGYAPPYTEKVCVRCSKYIDEITPVKTKITKEKAKQKVRHIKNPIIRVDMDTWHKICSVCGNIGFHIGNNNFFTCKHCGQRHEGL